MRRSNTRVRRLIVVTALSGAVAWSTGAGAHAATPKVGASCPKAQVGRTSGTLVCAKVGSKFRWQKTATAPAASVAAPAPSAGASGTATAAAGNGTPLTAEILGAAIGGTLTIENNESLAKVGLRGNELNPDGRCHLDALVTALVGCQGPITLAGQPEGLRWSIIGYKASEYTLDAPRRPARAKVGLDGTLFSPSSYGSNSAAVYWFTANGKQIRYQGSIKYLAMRLQSPNGTSIAVNDALEDAMLKMAGVVEAALVNR